LSTPAHRQPSNFHLKYLTTRSSYRPTPPRAAVLLDITSTTAGSHGSLPLPYQPQHTWNMTVTSCPPAAPPDAGEAASAALLFCCCCCVARGRCMQWCHLALWQPPSGPRVASTSGVVTTAPQSGHSYRTYSAGTQPEHAKGMWQGEAGHTEPVLM
jgi:hypothetical protein